MNTEDDDTEGEILYSTPLSPPFYYEVVVNWAGDKPNIKELVGLRKIWPPFADISLAVFRQSTGISRSLTIPEKLGRRDAENLVTRGQALGLDIVAHPLDLAPGEAAGDGGETAGES